MAATRSGAIGAALAAALAASGAAAQQAEGVRDIGSVAAANPDIVGRSERILNIADRVVENERIVTSAAGNGQLLFDDQSSLTIAPSSEIVLDRYVYDPDTGVGELAISAAKGALRFVGGRISKQRDVTIRAATATIGIRGGMALVVIEPAGVTIVSLAAETVRVSTVGEALVLARASVGAFVPRDGGPIVFLGAIDDARLDAWFALFEQGGDASSAPPSEIALLDLGGPYRQAVSTMGGEPDPGPRFESLFADADRLLEIVTGGGGFGTPLAGGGAGYFALGAGVGGGAYVGGAGFGFTQIFQGSRVGVGAGGEVLSIPIPTEEGEAYEYRIAEGAAITPFGAAGGVGYFDPEADFALALLEVVGPGDGEDGVVTARGVALFGAPSEGQRADQSVVSGDPITVETYALDFRLGADGVVGSPFGGVYHGFVQAEPVAARALVTPDADGAFGDGASKIGVALLSVEGEGEGQTSSFAGFASAFRSNGAAPQLDAELFGTAQADEPQQPAAVDTRLGLLEDGARNTFFGPDDRYFVLGNVTPFLDGDDDLDVTSGTAVAYSGEGSVVERSEDRFATLGLARKTDETTLEADARLPLAGANAGPGVDGALTGGFAAGVRDVVERSEGGFLRELPSAVRSTDAGGVTARFDRDANAVTVDIVVEDHVAGIPDGETIALTLGAAAADSAMTDDRRFVAQQRETVAEGAGEEIYGTRALLATSAVTGVAPIFPDGVDTEHEYLRWGHWSASVERDPGEDPSRVDRVHIGSWVAGDATTPEELAHFDGRVRHEGHAVVTVVENGSTYVDGGRYGLDFDFATRSGTATFDDLAGYNITAHVAENGGANAFSGTFAGVPRAIGEGPTVAGALDGAFFSGGDHPAAASAGAIDFASDDYTSPTTLTAAGIFAGEKPVGHD